MERTVKGFTLVEMLITLVILTSVMVVATQGYASFAKRWDGRLGQFQQTANSARALLLVKRAVNSIVPYVVHDEEGKGRYYFEGNLNGFVAVSSQGAFDSSTPAVVRLQLVPQEKTGYRLEYQEWPMVEGYLLHLKQQIPFSKPLVLMTDIVSPRFYFYGVENSELITASSDPEPQWFEDYNSVARGLMPQQVMLNLDNNEQIRFWLNDDDGFLGKYETYRNGI